MKNLSAISRLSLLAAFTILITLVVCLADFTVAEVNLNRFKEKQTNDDSSKQLPFSPYSPGKLKSKDDQKNFVNYIANFKRRHSLNQKLSNDFEDPDEEEETDGYGYDDDEYYHFNSKRNDDSKMNSNKESLGDSNKKDGLNSKKFMSSKNDKDDKESETIEMLNFKESHPSDSSHSQSLNQKPFAHDSPNKKVPSSGSVDSLKMCDIKKNSALEEKVKDEKDESSEESSGRQNISDGKKEIKTAENKDSLKESKTADDLEKKEKDAKLKEGKESIKASVEKEKIDQDTKNAKLTDNSKLDANIGSKDKEEIVKIAKEDKDSFREKTKDLSQISRASFVSSDYKDAISVIQTGGMEENEKSSGEINLRNPGLNNFQDNIEEKNENFRQDSNSRYFSKINNNQITGQVQGRPNDYFTLPIAFEIKRNNPEDAYKKGDSWSNQYKQEPHRLQVNYDRPTKGTYRWNLPKNELENPEYYKNYLKSLKHYKSMNDDQKILSSDSINFRRIPQSRFDDSFQNKKRSEIVNGNYESESNDDSCHSNVRRQVIEYVQLPNDLKAIKRHRNRRKSPNKLEYEIKIINRNDQNTKNSPLASYSYIRRKKDAKIKLTDHSDSRYSKKYPYSQVSRDDLIKINDFENEDQKLKRKDFYQANSRHVETREVPSGYYTNRVKFGQKQIAQNYDRQNNFAVDVNQIPSSQGPIDANPGFPSNANGALSIGADKFFFQKSWDTKSPSNKHDTIKRYDEFMNKDSIGGSLLLVKKDRNGDRVAKTFVDGNNKVPSDDEMNPDQLAKILSKDSNYVVLKKTDKNKYQKVSNEDSYGNHYDARNFPGKKSDWFEYKKSGSLDNNSRHTSQNSVISARSFNEMDPENLAKFRKSGPISGLKKTFEKFKDLADFFKDSEQDSLENHPLEVKEGSDIVFSEDKLPDPIIINSEENERSSFLKGKSSNSMSSISNNFKQSDQAGKTNLPENSAKDRLVSSVKQDNSETAWEPALKNAFPEAKSVNSIRKNGNEIILLDFDRNQLKTEEGNRIILPGGMKQTPGSGSPLTIAGDRQVEVVLSEDSLPATMQSTNNKLEPGDRRYQSDKENHLLWKDQQEHWDLPNNVQIFPSSQSGQIPTLFGTVVDKRPVSKPNKVVKKSIHQCIANPSSNYNQFLRDFHQFSEVNKQGYGQKKLMRKRNSNDISIPSSSFPELSTYSNANVKCLGSLLQNIMSNQNDESKENAYSNGGGYESEEYQKAGSLSMNLPGRNDDPYLKHQNQWSFGEDKTKDYPLLEEDSAQGDFKETGELLSSNDMRTSDDNDYQDTLWKELSAASGTIQRLRREGMNKEELRKAIEDVLSRKERRQFERSNDETKEKGGEIKTLNFENLPNLKGNSKKYDEKTKNNLMDVKRRKRRKRSIENNFKNKVSRTEVQNTLLKNLSEDNYQSVYSPGINRKLLSTQEADDAQRYLTTHNNQEEKDLRKLTCVKNAVDKFINPDILKLFAGDHPKEKKSRGRRSLTGSFHSDYKREIDLDESMPNDFQSFLVTSLGGFGSQKREVVKKEEALWENKESSQNNYNQIAENSDGGKGTNEDSALEKREVQNNDKKRENYFKNSGNEVKKLQKARSQDESFSKSKSNEFEEEKVPTQIRIQITNASSKKKKSPKSVMDGRESGSNEMETIPKEKEFFDKTKLNSKRINNPQQQLHQISKSKYSYVSNFGDGKNVDNADRQKLYVASRPYRRGKRKKKKYDLERSLKTLKDFSPIDQKAMEALIRKYLAEQSLCGMTTQKMPVSNHLPQVETVYNPTQGTDKAQLERYQLNKLNLINNKNAASVKNGLLANPGSHFDEGVIKNYIKEKSVKPKDKVYSKKFEGVDWQPFAGKSRVGQDLGHDAQEAKFKNYKNLGASSKGLNSINLYFDPYAQANNNYRHGLLKSNSEGNNLRENNLKTAEKTLYLADPSPYKINNQISSAYATSSDDASWNSKNYLRNNPIFEKHKSWSYFGSMPKNQETKGNKLNSNRLNNYRHSNSLQAWNVDENKDLEYLDSNEDYEDANKQDLENLLYINVKPNQLYQTPNYLFNDRNPNSEPINGDEEEMDEDYDENAEENDWDDYSLIAGANNGDSGITNTGYDREKLLNYHHPDYNVGDYSDSLYFKRNFYKLQEQPGFIKSKDRFEPASQETALTDAKMDSDLFGGSLGVLKEANRNSDIFRKNLIKSLSAYDHYNEHNQGNGNNRNYQNVAMRKSTWQGKLKRSKEYPKIGSRIFYATKTDTFDTKNLRPAVLDAQDRHSYFEVPQRNPLNAELRGSENEFEFESEENGNHFDGSLINTGKDNQNNDGNTSKRNSENSGTLEDVKENLEDDGEAISEDNVLENVIGKYIMRKRVSPRLKKENSVSDESKHEKQKRSLDAQTKVTKKRLSSGHLTENNFKKFHKKNLNRKRSTMGFAAEEKETSLTDSDEGTIEKTNEKKRSALDILKRITNKDKDNKKADGFDVRTAGFEPLLSFDEKKYQTYMKDGDEKKDSYNKTPLAREKEDREESNLVNGLQGNNYNGKRKEKSKNEYIGPSVLTVDGPWKVELNENYDGNSLSKEKNSLGDRKYPVSEGSQDLKAYLLISKDAKRFVEQPSKNEAENQLSQRLWKRSLEASFSRDGTPEGSGAQLPTKANPLFIEKENRALHEKSPPPPQRRAENASFVKTTGQNSDYEHFSSRRSNKRKYTFPASNAANIIEEGSHLSEETSVVLGQHIVEAILAHVSSNPRFKTVIAPGLAMTTPEYNDETENKNRKLHQTKFSEQVQSLLKNVMFEVEKLAEKHVKRRMCNRIDKQSKQFLHSLVNARMEKTRQVKIFDSDTKDCSEDNCYQLKTPAENSSVSYFARPLPMTYTAPNFSLDVYKNLKNKQCVLLKLIDDYQHLSKIEKETLEVNFQYLTQELEATNQAIETISRSSLPNTKLDNEMCAQNLTSHSEQQEANLYKDQPEKPESPELHCENCVPFELETKPPCDNATTTETPSFHSMVFEPANKQQNVTSCPNITNTAQPKTSKTLPNVFKFDPTNKQHINEVSSETTATTEKPFEKVLKCHEENNTSNSCPETKTQTDLDDLRFSMPTPQTFNLLPNSCSNMASNITKSPLKQSTNEEAKELSDKTSNFQLPGIYIPSELKKLGVKHVTALQLSVNNKRSEMDVIKGMENTEKPMTTGRHKINAKTLTDRVLKPSLKKSYLLKDSSLNSKFLSGPTTSKKSLDQGVKEYGLNKVEEGDPSKNNL